MRRISSSTAGSDDDLRGGCAVCHGVLRERDVEVAANASGHPCNPSSRITIDGGRVAVARGFSLWIWWGEEWQRRVCSRGWGRPMEDRVRCCALLGFCWTSCFWQRWIRRLGWLRSVSVGDPWEDWSVFWFAGAESCKCKTTKKTIYGQKIDLGIFLVFHLFDLRNKVDLIIFNFYCIKIHFSFS
jgi:hypothetical protein